MLHFLKRFGLSYYSVKQVRVRSATLGATYYLLCALIAAYFVYSFWVGHGYQAQGALLGSVDVKARARRRLPPASFAGAGPPGPVAAASGRAHSARR
jgi:ATP P2X receptor